MITVSSRCSKEILIQQRLKLWKWHRRKHGVEFKGNSNTTKIETVIHLEESVQDLMFKGNSNTTKIETTR